MRRRACSSAALIAAALAPTLAAPAARAAAVPAYGTAKVASVDGPGQLTIRAGKRTLRVALAPLDLPRTGECGAIEATTALRGFVKRAPRALRYQLVYSGGGGLVQDADGRYAALLAYTVRQRYRDLASDLIAADWARTGIPATLTGGPPDLGLADQADNGPGGAAEAGPRARRGLWASCGGRAHLPSSDPVPTTAAQPWTVDAQGITTSIGSIALSPRLAPGSGPTIRQLAELTPLELGWSSTSTCRAWLPALQLRAFGYAVDGTCADAVVESFRSIGPEGATLTRGGALASPAADLRGWFPLLELGRARFEWPLSGPSQHQWAWQTVVTTDATKRAIGLVTYASPEPPR